MIRTVSLAIWLFAFWLLLSGHYTLWLVGAGIVISGGIAVIGRLTGFADEEGHPVERILGGLGYWPWLAIEMVKSSIDVARTILDPRRPIEPQLFEISVGPKTAVGAVTYANSITLTPGTVTVAVDREHDRFTIHALTKAGAEGVRSGEMDRRVVAFEKGGRT
ncbi:multisubunit sodium/proton antiporter, MrpE subunit [Kaistia soli DSM 19436]|uniref:Multisubunit sodium/proton antiporter, MrpE subunit n=1 Tax=Kaistia soli DSM 19436 TaxID=1122133 RepID=A0A1M4V471_9HYPH|nr:Na+/H+ antiporter subunit E [Kaistia soli]SHE63745.1 multisubunit sodium/proton antiporter, MrpE subunit [Kaistia soli DSM 19436]